MWLLSRGKLSFHTVWIILECDEELRKLYAHLYKTTLHQALSPPKFGAHISVVRGNEEGIAAGLWQRNLDGPTVSFEYSPEVQEDDHYVWLDARSEELEKLRDGLGLTRQPPFGLHLTLGRKS